MTNFSDLGVQQRDFGAYAFAPGAGHSGLTDKAVLNSDSPDLLAHNKWDLYVRVCALLRRPPVLMYTNPHFQLGVCYNS